MYPKQKHLTKGLVRAIRAAPCPDAVAAREFELSLSTIVNVRRRRVHADVPDEWPAPGVGARRLTDEQVRAIRASRLTLAELADRYGLSKAAVSMIRRREQIYLDVD